MTTGEIIKILDTKENRVGGATGKERRVYLQVNGLFLGDITDIYMDGHGDGLVTDVCLCIESDEDYVCD